MSVSTGSTDRDGGKELIDDLWRQIEFYQQSIERQESSRGRPIAGRLKCDLSIKEVADGKELMVFAAHRLAFLEMVTTGMTYQEMHDAQAYAKFVEKKRKLEDLDLNELRVLLR